MEWPLRFSGRKKRNRKTRFFLFLLISRGIDFEEAKALVLDFPSFVLLATEQLDVVVRFWLTIPLVMEFQIMPGTPSS